MAKKEVIVIVIIFILAIILYNSTKFTGKSLKEYYYDYDYDVSSIIEGKELSLVVGDMIVIKNIIKPTDSVEINVLKINSEKKQMDLSVEYGGLEQSFKVGLYGRGRVDVDLDGRDDLEISMLSMPAEGRAVTFLKSL